MRKIVITIENKIKSDKKSYWGLSRLSFLKALFLPPFSSMSKTFFRFQINWFFFFGHFQGKAFCLCCQFFSYICNTQKYVRLPNYRKGNINFTFCSFLILKWFFKFQMKVIAENLSFEIAWWSWLRTDCKCCLSERKYYLKEIGLKKIHKRHQKIPIFFATAGFSNSFFAILLNFYARPNTFRIFKVSRSKYQIVQFNNNLAKNA